MSFLQKNKSMVVILLMDGFLVAILSIFVSGITDSNSDTKPTDVLSQQMDLATSTGNVPPAVSSDSTPMPDVPSGTVDPLPGVTQIGTETPPSFVSSLTPTAQSSVTETPSGADAPPPPTVVDGPPGTDFPPPLTFVPPPTETPPPGNGDPPGS